LNNKHARGVLQVESKDKVLNIMELIHKNKFLRISAVTQSQNRRLRL